MAGRRIFISGSKQAQERSAHRISIWMKVIIALVITCAVIGVGVLVFGYLIPYFQAELSSGNESSEASLSSGEVSLPVYNDLGLPVYGDEVSLFLINSDNPAGKDSVPETEKVGGVQVDRRISDALRMLIDAAKKDGLVLEFTRGYVSYEEQEQLYEEKVEELISSEGKTTVMARAEAKSYVPAPGESDFQTGLCLKLTGNVETFNSSKTYTWLQNNMGRYGFVFRYPKDKEQYTGVAGDDTVIRYVGSANAESMRQRSMCLEEYITYLNNQ